MKLFGIPMTVRTLKFCSLGVLAVMILALVFFAGFVLMRTCSMPDGKYASYILFPHDEDDVVIFDDGQVLLDTCCGEEYMGTYRQMENGQWIWTNAWRNPVDPLGPRITQDVVIQPQLFGIVVFDAPGKKNGTFLRYRFFRPNKWGE